MFNQFVSLLERFSTLGFLDTKAPLYMDIVVSYLAALPFLIAFSIFLAARRNLKLHQLTQTVLFLLTFSILGLFAYSVHYHFGLNTLLEKTSMPHNQAMLFLFGHIVIAIFTIVSWFLTLVYAISDRKRRALPGVYSRTHKRAGRRVFLAIFLTSTSAVVLYWMFFVA
jgi:uncharacterized membrane protein YozB (DUF420 family)